MSDLAIKLSKIVHDACPDAPHDIGLKLEAEIINRQWISVKDRLPERNQRVLLYDKMFNEIHNVVISCLPETIDSDYTHWMPLPEPPTDAD